MSGQYQTISQYFLSQAMGDARNTAWRRKERGVWRSVSWGNALQEVATLAGGLANNGLTRGDTAVIICDKSYHWVVANHAIQGLGAIVAPLIPDVSLQEAKDCLQQITPPKIVLTDDEETARMVGNALAASNLDVPIFVAKPNRVTPIGTDSAQPDSGQSARGKPPFQLWPRVGKGNVESAIQSFREEAELGQSDDLASIIFQTGRTGSLGSVRLTHKDWLENVAEFAQRLQLTGSDETICTVAPAYAAAKMLYQVAAVVHGYCVNFPETPETVLADMREIGPTQVLISPAGCKHIAVSSIAQMGSAGWMKRSLFEAAQRRFRRQIENSGTVALGGVWGALGTALICKSIREVLGLARVKSALTFAMHPGTDAAAFFSSIGLDFKKLHDEKIDEVQGGLGVRISDFSFLETPSCDSEEIEVSLDERKRLTVNRDTEGALCTSAYIKRAVVVSSGKEDATALIQLDTLASKDWADRQDVHYESVDKLPLNSEVLQLIENEVRVRDSKNKRSVVGSSNRGSPRVGKFVLLRKDLDPDQGELTHLRTPNYQSVVRNYGSLLEAAEAAGNESGGLAGRHANSRRLFQLQDSCGVDYGGSQVVD